MKFTVIAAALLLTAVSAGTASADQAAADGCAAGLSGDAKTIYDAALPGVSGGGDVRTVVTDTTRSMVEAGTIGKSSAKSNAQAAGACLAKL